MKLRSREPEIIPAGQKVVLEGFANVNEMNNEECALLEQPTVSSLPGGVFTDSCLITIPTGAPYKIPVVLSNESSHDVVLPNNCIIAEFSVPQNVIQTQNTAHNQRQGAGQSCPMASCSSQQQPVN